MATSILIVGGGFAGVEAARALERKKMPNTSIRLLDPKTYFEYHAALYRFATGKSPIETCIPYREIFSDSCVEVLQDAATTVDLSKKLVIGASGSHYAYDILILALGSQSTTFGIPGVSDFSFGMKSAVEAHRLKTHIDESFSRATGRPKDEQETLMHVAVIGGGACGIELASELVCYCRKLALLNTLDPSLLQIDLIEAGDRLLSNLSPRVSAIAESRLRALGVNVHLSSGLIQEDKDCVYLKDRDIRCGTVIWTAGIVGHELLKRIAGLTLDRKGRVEVDELLRARGQSDVFVAGDSAATRFSGMAQTALSDATFIAAVIDAIATMQKPPVYTQTPPVYAIPVGRKWALVVRGARIHTGVIGWMFRRIFDLRVFLRFLPASKAIRTFLCGYKFVQ